jgi:hypothetical protein
MPLWRIRVAVPDSPASRSAVKQALAAQPVSYLRVVPSDEASSTTSEILVEVPQDDGLTSVLSALHAISPQVFVSRCRAAPGSPARRRRGIVGESPLTVAAAACRDGTGKTLSFPSSRPWSRAPRYRRPLLGSN